MSGPLRVLHLVHDSRRSGVPAVVAAIMRACDPAEVVPAALFAYDGIYARELRNEGFQVWTLGKRLPLLWRLNRFLLNLWLPFLVGRFDVVHIHSCVMAFSVVVCRALGKKVVFHLHEKPGRTGGGVRRAALAADCVVFCARNGARHYRDVSVRRSRTILNAVPLPSAVPYRADLPPYRLVMLGSINRNKGQDLLVRAFARLERRDAELWLYGTVGLSARRFVRELRRFIEERGMAGRVHLCGPTSDAPSVLREATILVHASLNECLSISVLEAMSWGLPVIAYDIEGMDEIVTDGVDGFLVPPGDEAELAGRIEALLADGALRRAVGSAARRTVSGRFDMKTRIHQFAELYREITEKT